MLFTKLTNPPMFLSLVSPISTFLLPNNSTPQAPTLEHSSLAEVTRKGGSYPENLSTGSYWVGEQWQPESEVANQTIFLVQLSTRLPVMYFLCGFWWVCKVRHLLTWPISPHSLSVLLRQLVYPVITHNSKGCILFVLGFI